MSVTLDRIYYTAMRKYKMKLVAGSGGIWGQVTWIHQVEDKDVIGFLKGGELVVITGITNIGSESLFDYTEQLISKEACGLIINIGPYIKSVPESVLKLAEEHQFPVFTLPWDVHLVEFNREFCNEIMKTDQKSKNLCAAFRMAVFSPEKAEEYLPVLEDEGIGSDNRFCMVKCMPTLTEGEDGVDITKLFYDIRTYFERCVNKIFDKYVIFRKDHFLTMILPASEKSVIQNMLQEMLSFPKWQDGKGSLTFAVSDLSLEIKKLSQYYDALTWMCRIEYKEQIDIGFMDELGIATLFLTTKDKKFLEQYKEREIGTLEQYDAENATDYCNILYAYLKCNGKMSDVAELCYLHRNTISYHLKKISEILQCDLYSTVDRTKYYLALRIKELLEI